MKKQTTTNNSDCLANLVQDPTHLDVLCGKNKFHSDHEGTQRFRKVIETYRQRYAQALTKFDKMCVTKEIYDLFVVHSARFLKFNHKAQAWQELTDATARDKIGHALRFANREKRRPVRKPSKQSGGTSVTENILSPPMINAPRAPVFPSDAVVVNALPSPTPLPPQEIITYPGSLDPLRLGDLSDMDVESESEDECSIATALQHTKERMMATAQNTLKLVDETVALLKSCEAATGDVKLVAKEPLSLMEMTFAPLQPRAYMQDDLPSVAKLLPESSELIPTSSLELDMDACFSPAIFA